MPQLALSSLDSSRTRTAQEGWGGGKSHAQATEPLPKAHVMLQPRPMWPKAHVML